MPPLVTIGVPTYNRAALCERAVRSALAQDHGTIEVVVSNDASPDDTLPRLRTLAAADDRLRVLDQPENLGHARNFQAVLDAARGEYFMWLSDDDHLDPGYVSACLGELLADPGLAIVGGTVRYESAAGPVLDERPTDLTARRPGGRVLQYLLRVNNNGILFGVARRDDLRAIGFEEVVGGDWLLVSALAAKGRARTVSSVTLHRSADGLSSDRSHLAESFGIRGFLARHHHLLVASAFARDIASSPRYAALPRLGRPVTAALAALVITLRFPGHLAARWLLERLRLQRVEELAIRWVRSRD